jgi:hypothetical protein
MSEITFNGPRVGVGDGVGVFVGVVVAVGVAVAVCVGVGVGVLVGVAVGVGVLVGVLVAVAVGVFVGVGVAVGWGVGVFPQAATSVLSPARRRKVRRLKMPRSDRFVIGWGAPYSGLRATATSFSLSPLNSSRS